MLYKEMQELATHWDIGRKFSDHNRDILRHIYNSNTKADRKAVLKIFAQEIGLNYSEICKVGQFSRMRDDQKRRKYGQDIRKPECDYTGIFDDFNRLSRGAAGKRTSGGKIVDMAAGQFFGK